MAFVAVISCCALLVTPSSRSGGRTNFVQAFQTSYRQLNNVAITSSSTASRAQPLTFSECCGGGGSSFFSTQQHYRRCRRSITSIEMKTKLSDINMDGTSHLPSSPTSLFPSPTSSHQPKVRQFLHRLRRKFTTLLASLAFFLSLLCPAHASSTASASISYPTSAISSLTTTTTTSLMQRLNLFRTQSTNELIDNYVRSKLFDDDVYDPVESAYREAISDHSTSGSSSIGKKDAGKVGGGIEGAYPTLLAETANAALGQQRSVSSVLSSSSSSTMLSKNNRDSMKNDGLTSLLIQASDVLQSKLGVSASTSYSIVAAVGIVGICVVPAGLGVLYQSIQRMQIDRSEMKMYGKITE